MSASATQVDHKKRQTKKLKHVTSHVFAETIDVVTAPREFVCVVSGGHSCHNNFTVTLLFRS